MSYYSALEPGRLDVTLDSAGVYVVTFDGVEILCTEWPDAVRRECVRLFLKHAERYSSSGARLNAYKVNNVPPGQRKRILQAIDHHLDELREAVRFRGEVGKVMHSSALQRHWVVPA